MARVACAIPGGIRHTPTSKRTEDLARHARAEVRLTTADVLKYLDRVEADRRIAGKLAHSLYRDPSDPALARYLREHGLRIALHASDITTTHLAAIQKVHRSETMTVLTTDPFQCIGRVRGITYERASALWRRLGQSAGEDPVPAAAIREVLRTSRERGDVWSDRWSIARRAQALCGRREEEIDRALDAFIGAGAMTEVRHGTQRRLMRTASLETEREIAARVRMRTARYASADRLDVYMAMRESGILDPDPLQMDAVACALENQVCLITGGPGTGKSTIQSAIRLLVEREHPGTRIRLVSLAARVARAIGERTGIDAETIHTVLGMGPNGTPLHGPGEPLPDDLIILEEGFMIGNRLFADLLAAMKPDARLIIVGDREQLPPISEGKPVEAIMNSGIVAMVELKTNHRSASRDIPEAGRLVMRGHLIRDSANVKLVPVRREADGLRCITETFNRLSARGGTVQILTAMHEGPLGTTSINRTIAGRSHIGLHDTVMQIENDRERGILNGEIGTVVSCSDQQIIIERDDGTQTAYRKSEFRQLVQAWAITYHKAQGLEYDHVVLVTSPSQRRMLSRNLINVGITRAKRTCVIIDHREGLKAAIAIETTNRRTTMLEHILRGEPIAQGR